MRPSCRLSNAERLWGALLCLLLAFGALAWPQGALADVRRTDALVGGSVLERGIAAADCPSIDAEYAVLMDGDGELLFERNAREHAHIASITKVMTAIVALEHGSLDDVVTVGAEAAAIGESTAELRAGDSMTLEAALEGMLVPSGNDAAYAIAECLGAQASGAEGEEAVEAFVGLMNETARTIGMEDSLFANPHGLDNDAFDREMYSTAADTALMCRYAMGFDAFRAIVSKPEATIDVERDGQTQQVVLHSTDQLLEVYEGACGVKTGNTEVAGPCFAGACDREGRAAYAIVLHSSSEAQRFSDTQALFNWYYDSFVDYRLAHSDVTASMPTEEGSREVPVVAEVANASWLDKTVKATLSDPDATVEVFSMRGNVSQEFELGEAAGTVRIGDVLGKVRFYQANELIAEADVVACEEQAGPNPIESIGIAWERFLRSLSGESQVAETQVLNECPLILNREASLAG